MAIRFKKSRDGQAEDDDDLDAEGFQRSNVRREHQGMWADIQRHTSVYGGPTIFAFLLARLAGCITLLALSIVTVVAEELSSSNVETLGRKHHHHKDEKWRYFGREWSIEEWLDFWMSVTFVRML